MLLVHGWQGSSGDHWQALAAERLAAAGVAVRLPALPDPWRPRPEAWLRSLRAELRAAGPGARVACHSLGAILWLHHAAAPGAVAFGVEAVLLVAPPSPAAGVAEIADFWPAPLEPAALDAAAASTRLVCGDDDPYCPEGAAALYGERLGIDTEVVPGGGHLNPDAGLGRWPAVERWCAGRGAGPLDPFRPSPATP